jgi:hypothetical protein
MEIDTAKIDEAVLALLYLTLHDGSRAWKGFDWDTLNRLHAKGDLGPGEQVQVGHPDGRRSPGLGTVVQ